MCYIAHVFLEQLQKELCVISLACPLCDVRLVCKSWVTPYTLQ